MCEDVSRRRGYKHVCTKPRPRGYVSFSGRQTDRQTSLYVLFEMYMYVVRARFVDLDQVPTHRWTYLRRRLSPERKSPCWNGKLTVEVALRSRRATHRNSTHKEQKHDAYIRTDTMSQHAIQGDGHERKENECVILFRIAVSTSPRVFHRFFMPLRLCHSLSLSLCLSLLFLPFPFPPSPYRFPDPHMPHFPPCISRVLCTCMHHDLSLLFNMSLLSSISSSYSSSSRCTPPYSCTSSCRDGLHHQHHRSLSSYPLRGATQNPATERAM